MYHRKPERQKFPKEMPFKMNNDKHLSGYISSRERSYCSYFPVFILAGGSVVKNLPANARDNKFEKIKKIFPGSRRSLGDTHFTISLIIYN